MKRTGFSLKPAELKRHLTELTRAVAVALALTVITAFLVIEAFLGRSVLKPSSTDRLKNDGLHDLSGGTVLDGTLSNPILEEEDISEIMDCSEYGGALALELYDSLFQTAPSAAVPKGELKIVSTDLSKSPSDGKLYVKNNTSYKLNAKESLSADKMTLPAISGGAARDEDPIVLIYHTHGTEGYAEEGKTSYAKKNLPRSTDTSKNVVAVGEALAQTLVSLGVPTYHCKTMFDKGDYNHAYQNSRAGVDEILKQYPSIRYIFDLHRDALSGDGVTYKVLTYDESTPIAQVMLVVGTDSAGADHGNWRENFAFAVDVQYLMTKRLSNIMRPICIKNSSYSQELSPRAMLIEIGTCVNTLSEAKEAALILGQTLAAYITAEQG